MGYNNRALRVVQTQQRPHQIPTFLRGTAMTVSDSSIATHVCTKCSEEKPLTKEFWFPDSRRSNGFKKHACRVCLNIARRESCREYTQKRRSTEEGRTALRASVRQWKARNPDKVNAGHRRTTQRRAEREGRKYKPRFIRREIADHQNKARNARIAFRKFIDESSDEEVKCWYAAIGKPWLNPRLTESQKWSVRYQTDLEFNAREKARLYAKKMRRKHGIAITDDGTTSATLLIDARSCLYCGAEFDDRCKPTLDHLIPLTRGGTHSAANLVVCCLSCNSRKGKCDFLEFVKTLPDPYQARSLRAWRKLRGAPPQQQVLIG